MNILLTGATGFMGSHLLPALLEQGHTVTAVARSAVNLPCTVVVANLTDPACTGVLGKALQGCDTVIHLAAAIPSQSNAIESVEEMLLANVKSTEHLLNSLPQRVSHVIVASTLDVYGPPQFLPLTESHPLLPQSAYAQSKVACEQYAEAVCAGLGVPLTILRFTQVYGPREKPIKAIPLFIQSIAAGKAPVLFGDGSDTRDYLYVTDAACAIALAAEKKQSGILNVASGHSVNLKEVVETIIQISGKKLTPLYKERQKEKINIAFDISRLTSVLGFEAKTSMQEGLRLTYDWYLAQHS